MQVSILSPIILGASGLIITFVFSRHSTKLANDRIMQDLFKEFNIRYSDLHSELTFIQEHFPELEELEKAENSAELKATIINYFILCAEEYYWYYHKKRLDKIIWDSWHQGMNYWYNHVPAIKALWKREIAENGLRSYYIDGSHGFFIDKE